ncbi:hypothetical protein [Parasitella parasitica]|uniref:IPT/TIG domain-containing protein n=1 Tax=Parasitella parasitica TaxID=35722 RepID=A0A0B7NNT8_9FUNG|nr:hypothetical protein [Parasitella parasitica]
MEKIFSVMDTKTKYFLTRSDTHIATSMSPPTSPLNHQDTISPYQTQNKKLLLDDNMEHHQYQRNAYHASSYKYHHDQSALNKAATVPYTSNDGLQIHVDGIPDSGAKSRVETQIKLCVSLTTRDGIKVPYWSYIRIPDSMLARSKLRKSQQQKLLDGSAAAMVSDESKVLDLEARVVCESDEHKRIKMCQGCVRRERKRAERKKDSKPSIQEMNSGVIEKAFERDRKRILLFNCEPLVNFSSGDAILPTRITCYCRHHNERIGFRVRFTLKDNKGMVVATGDSPPIMITDDHKTSKQCVPSVPISRKRGRAVSCETEDGCSALITPVSSRKTSVCKSEPESENSPRQTSVIADSINLSYFAGTSSSNMPSVLDHFTVSPLPTPSEEGGSTLTTSPKTPTAASCSVGSPWETMMPYSSVQIPLSSISNLHHRRTQSMAASAGLSHEILLRDDDSNIAPNPHRCRVMPDALIADTCSPSLLTTASMQPFPTVDYALYSMTTSAPVSPASVVSPENPIIPTLDRILPSQGPITGGVEITIIGDNFHRGLTLMFGNRAATTVCCNSNSIVCILPPAEHNGSVVVSFKEHPLLRTSPAPPLFDYVDSSNQLMVELCNQVVGNHTPSVMTPSASHNLQSQSSSTPPTSYSGESSNQYHRAEYQQNTELEVLNMLSSASLHGSWLAQTTVGGQNLLHLAAYLNYPTLAAFLVSRNLSLVQLQDRNGLSPLHFSCHSKANLVMLKSGADIDMPSSIGTPLEVINSTLYLPEYDHMTSQLLNPQIASFEPCGMVTQLI